jgi:uncharacterized protein (TIGR02246 family)
MSQHSPSDMHEAFAQATNAGDLDALVGLFDKTAVIVERDGELTTGPAAVRTHLAELLDLHPKMTILATRAYVNDELALLCSRWTATITAPDGASRTMEFRGSEVARLGADGTWRLVIDNPWGIDLAPAS